jgi:hypothetical protein
MRDLNELASIVHAANEKWWTDLGTGVRIVRNKGELLMLMVSEIAEAMEGERKNLMDDKLTHRKYAEVEMADTVIRALDYAGGFGYELQEVASLPPVENRGEALMRLTRLVSKIYDAETLDARMGIPHMLSKLIASCEAYCDACGYDLWGAYEEKMDFNRTRVDHTLEARRAAGGKKF